MVNRIQCPIYLWGFMGCGKSSLGRSLAHVFNFPFYETDSLVQELANESILAIFKNKGELAFREYEREILYSIPTNEPAIVSTGGGLPCFGDNALWMRKHGLTLYLSLSSDELANRLERSTNNRPLLQEKKGNELRMRITEMLIKREPIYRLAHLAIDANLASPTYLKELLEKYEMLFMV